MKVLVLLSLVALCYSRSTDLLQYPRSVDDVSVKHWESPVEPTTVGLRHVTVTEDGAIVVTGVTGNQIHIHKDIVNPKKIVVDIKTPYEPLKRIVVDDIVVTPVVDSMAPTFKNIWSYIKNSGEHYSQYNVLLQIVHENEGVLNEEKYQILLEKVHQLVQLGVLQESIYDWFKSVDNQMNIYNLQHLRHVTVTEDGAIVVVGVTGNQIHIHKDIMNPKKIVVDIKTPYAALKRIVVDDIVVTPVVESLTPTLKNIWSYIKNSGEQYSQYHILLQLVRENQGVLNEEKYQILLEKVHQLVQLGVLYESIYDLFRFVDNQMNTYNLQQLRSTGVEQIIPVQQQEYIPYQRNPLIQQEQNLGNLLIKNGKLSSNPWAKYGQLESHVPQYVSYPYQQLVQNKWIPITKNIQQGSYVQYGLNPWTKNEQQTWAPWTKYGQQVPQYLTPFQQLKTQAEEQQYVLNPWTKTVQQKWAPWTKYGQQVSYVPQYLSMHSQQLKPQTEEQQEYILNPWTKNVQQKWTPLTKYQQQYETYPFQHLEIQTPVQQQYELNPWNKEVQHKWTPLIKYGQQQTYVPNYESQSQLQQILEVPQQWTYPHQWQQHYTQMEVVPQTWSQIPQQPEVY